MASLSSLAHGGATRWLAAGILLAGCLCCLAGTGNEPVGSVANVPETMAAANASQPSTPGATNGAKSTERLRENTRLVDVSGIFQSVGAESVLFTPKEGTKDSLRVLENLALERISRSLEESRGSRPGVVSGFITEYRGANYLFVTKVVFQAQDGEAAVGK